MPKNPWINKQLHWASKNKAGQKFSVDFLAFTCYYLNHKPFSKHFRLENFKQPHSRIPDETKANLGKDVLRKNKRFYSQ